MTNCLICNRCGAEDLNTDNIDGPCQVCHAGILVPMEDQKYASFHRAQDRYEHGDFDRRNNE